jgi:hypothetical protein
MNSVLKICLVDSVGAQPRETTGKGREGDIERRRGERLASLKVRKRFQDSKIDFYLRLQGHSRAQGLGR